MTGTLAALATVETPATERANRGPRMSSAPCEIASLAAARAPSAVPLSSFTKIWMLAVLKSRSARSAALRKASAIWPALPVADSGKRRATRPLPVPMV